MNHSILYLLSIAILITRSLSEIPEESSTCKASPNQKECANEDNYRSKNIRLVTREELESKTGENGSEIWLSVLGEVYNVTSGESFYGIGKSYGNLAGTDCSVCYVSGIFTAEEAAKNIDEISDAMLPGVLEWVGFYGTHESYSFVGYLIDHRFYNDKGEPTANLVGVRKRISSMNK